MAVQSPIVETACFFFEFSESHPQKAEKDHGRPTRMRNRKSSPAMKPLSIPIRNHKYHWFCGDQNQGGETRCGANRRVPPPRNGVRRRIRSRSWGKAANPDVDAIC